MAQIPITPTASTAPRGTKQDNPGITLNLEQEQAFIKFTQQAQEMLHGQYSIRHAMELVDRSYQREENWTEAQLRARAANRNGDKAKIQDVTIPILKPQVDAGVTYFTEVFLSGYPIFDINAAPQYEQTARQLAIMVAEQSITAGWARQLLMFFRDGLKYNLQGIECTWNEINTPQVQNSVTGTNGVDTKNVIWQGNVLRRMDLYNTFWDPRVHPSEIHAEGEYAGYHELMSRTRFKKLCNNLYMKADPATIIRALKSTHSGGIQSSQGAFGYYMPMINPTPMINNNTASTNMDWMQWASLNPSVQNYGTNNYLITRVYVRIIPSDFNMRVPGANTPQVWKLTIVNAEVVLQIERQTNAHDWLPIFFGQPNEDGLDYQTKSFAQNVQPEQDIASALMSGYIASKRRLVGDRVLYDPMRVREKDINNKNPAAKIPVRPAAYGKPLEQAVYAFPYRDEAVQTMLDGAMRIKALSMEVNSINPAQTGQFVKGNKTKQEYDDTMGHGNGPFRTMSILMEAQVFTPLKECIKLNILQYGQNQTITDRETGEPVAVDMVALRNSSLNFMVSDGELPTSKLMSSDDWTVAMQTIGSSQQIGQEYNLGDMFSFIMQQRDIDLSPFQKPQTQVQYEQQMQAWQQAAAMAAQKGTAFSTPMPQPPPPPPNPGTTPTSTPGQAPLATGPTGQLPANVVQAGVAQQMQQAAKQQQQGPAQQQPPLTARR